MTAQPADPAPGPYETIHLGGQAAVVVPADDFARLRAAQQTAMQRESQIEELLDALEEAGRTAGLDETTARRILGVPAGGGDEGGLSTDEVRRRLGLPQ